MESNRYQLRIHDFKKMVRYIVTYVVLSIVGSAIIVGSLHNPPGSQSRTIPMEVFLIGFFVLVSVAFVLIQKKSMVTEDVVVDARGIHTNRFGSLYFDDISAYQVFRKKRSEDLILLMRDGRKIAFGPVNFRHRTDQTYLAFKEIISKQVPKKGYTI